MNKLSIQHCSKLALKTGRIILESGGATNRVELMMKKICISLGYPDCESFVTPTGSFLSLSDGESELRSSIKRFGHRRIDLGKITEISRVVNCLETDSCQRIPTTKVNIWRRTKSHRYSKTLPMWVNNVCGAATSDSSASFRRLLERIRSSPHSRFLGCHQPQIHLQTSINGFLLNALAAMLIVLIAKTIDIWVPFIRLDVIIIGGIMILVPGLQIVNAIRDTMSGDLVAGTARGVEAIIMTVGIVAGSGAMLKIWELWS
jgi:uncharacterized membrane protein YjjP (DUF1212 family)